MLRRASRFDDSGARRRLLVAACAGVAIVLVGGAAFAAGRMSAQVSAAPPVAASSSATSTPPASAGAGPARVVAGVPVSFAHSPEGAAAAARAFLGVEVSDLMAQPDAYRAAWREMCTPEYFAATGRAQAESVITNQEANNHLISNASAGQVVLERAFPLTEAVTAYADDQAAVRTWALVVAHPGDGPTIVSFAAGTLELRWTQGDWRLDGGGASASVADGASGPLVLDGGPSLPAYLEQRLGMDDVPPSR